MCGSDGTPVFVWQPEMSSANKLTNGSFPSDLNGWSPIGWSASSGTARSIGVGPNTLSQDVSNQLEGGKTYEMTFTVSGVTASSTVTSFRCRIDDVDIFPPTTDPDTTFNQTYTFRFVCPAHPEELIFTVVASDATANSVLQLDNISIAFQTKAFPLNEAP